MTIPCLTSCVFFVFFSCSANSATNPVSTCTPSGKTRASLLRMKASHQWPGAPCSSQKRTDQYVTFDTLATVQQFLPTQHNGTNVE